MSAPCQSVCQCPAPTIPGLGFQTEVFTAPLFVATVTAPAQPPPLGYAFSNPVATAFGQSSTSQQDAGQQAYQTALAQAQADWKAPKDEWWPDVEPITLDLPEELMPVEPIF